MIINSNYCQLDKVAQDAQDDRSQICLNYVTKGPNVFANISR